MKHTKIWTILGWLQFEGSVGIISSFSINLKIFDEREDVIFLSFFLNVFSRWWTYSIIIFELLY